MTNAHYKLRYCRYSAKFVIYMWSVFHYMDIITRPIFIERFIDFLWMFIWLFIYRVSWLSFFIHLFIYCFPIVCLFITVTCNLAFESYLTFIINVILH